MERELRLLKKVALAIEKLDGPYSCALNTEEKGYMYIDLLKEGREVGAIYVVDPVIDRYGCFIDIKIEGVPDADEFYTTDIAVITDLLSGQNTEQVKKKIAQSREKFAIQTEEIAYGADGIEDVKEVINKRVAKGGGYKATHAGKPAIFFEDGNVIYVFTPDGEFVTILNK